MVSLKVYCKDCLNRSTSTMCSHVPSNKYTGVINYEQRSLYNSKGNCPYFKPTYWYRLKKFVWLRR